MEYTQQTFNIPTLKGISPKTIEEHMKLYAGYVKSANGINSQIAALSKDPAEVEKNTYMINELQRRFGFEFDGMRNHEYYFKSLEGGPASCPADSTLKKEIESEWGSFDVFLGRFKSIAMTRGIGWAMLYYDNQAKNAAGAPGKLTLTWVEEQHLGHLTGLAPILCLDMWEHSYMLDYAPSEKKKYVEAFFDNLNWTVIEKNFADAC